MRTLALTLLAGALLACGDGTSVQEGNLIGGERVARDAYAATVRLPQSRCTATLVGERELLTAAHCVFDAGRGAPMPAYAPDAVLAIDTAGGTIEARIEETFVSPTWAESCAHAYCGIAEVAARQDAADVALIRLHEPLSGAAIAPISAAPAREGDLAVLTGFGCEEGLYEEDSRDDATLAAGESRVVPPSDAVHDGSYITEDDVEIAGGNYFMTAGPAHPNGGAGLCPGDSGGPVYRERDGALEVIGVNANYSLGPEADDPSGLPITNWHTRLDASSRHEIAAWVANALGDTSESVAE